MRKITLELEPNELMKKDVKPLFEIIHSLEVLEMLKIEWEDGIVVDLVEFVLKEPHSIHDQKSIGHYEILSVLKSEGNKHTCIVKYQNPDDYFGNFKEFDLDLIFTPPIVISEDKQIYSAIGGHKNLTRFIELMKQKVGKVVNMTFKKAVYQRQDLLSVLTEKQKEIMITAHKNGYYDYPKKINTEGLAKKVSISRATMVQHLRKAESRILTEIMDGYTS
jgi:hypothetical protein